MIEWTFNALMIWRFNASKCDYVNTFAHLISVRFFNYSSYSLYSRTYASLYDNTGNISVIPSPMGTNKRCDHSNVCFINKKVNAFTTTVTSSESEGKTVMYFVTSIALNTNKWQKEFDLKTI